MTCPHCQTQLANGARFCPACGKATSPTEAQIEPAPATADMIGREIAGRYRILAKLGEGGMGAVYRGQQISLKRAVAVKLLRPELSANAQLLRRFNAEAEVVAKLSHPNTVNIYDFGQDTDGALFIAMEFIEGQSLRGVIQNEAPFAPARAVHIATQIAASLADAHVHGIVHRDLKPDNVMLQDRGRQRDVVRVLDFGIAKLRDDSRQTQVAMTQAGDMLGTPQYMAPEQIRGDEIDGRTDVYALGCMLYEMVTGRMAFEAPTVMAMLSKHLLEEPIAPSQRRPDLALPPAIDQLVLAAMAKDPARRPATMEQLGEQLAALLPSLPSDPNRSASAARSAMQAIPSPPPSTPAAAYPSPAPGVYAHPTPAPPPRYTPPAMPYVPPAIPPTLPIGGGAPQPPPTIAPAPRSRRTLYVMIAIGVVGVAGLGVWARSGSTSSTKPTKQGSDSAAPTKPDKPDDPWNHANTGPSIPTVPTPQPPMPTPAPVPPPHPRPGPASVIGTAEMPIPAGAGLRPPAGYVQVALDPKSLAYQDAAHGALIVMAPLIPGTNDPAALAAYWTKHTGFKKLGEEHLMSAGAARVGMTFQGTLNNVRMGQVIVIYLSPKYRLGVLMQAPAELFTNPAFQQEAEAFFTNGVVLP